MIESIEESLSYLKEINPRHEIKQKLTAGKGRKLRKVLVANRGEIAKRFFLSLKEEGIPSVAIVTDVDLGQSWFEQADEVIVIGDMRNYTNVPIVVAAALLVEANAIYPGYGFLSEEAAFVEMIKEAAQAYKTELIFMGPDSSIMHRVGDKLAARKLAKEQGVPLFEGSPALPDNEAAKQAAAKIGYPVIVKLSAGGGGKGMMPVHAESGLYLAIDYCQRTGRNLYKNDTFYLEKFIERPVHMEVQIFNGMAIGIRKCAVQRRNQKVVEEDGDVFLDSHTILSMLAAAENMARISGYAEGAGAGTVEFLFDPDSQKFGFLEMNARLQVEHPVTDQSVGIDLAKWQILYFDDREDEIPYELALKRRFVEKRHSIEARIYAEDPENEYAPAPGKITELDLPTFNGIRCDFGFKKGDQILPHYDPMIGKVIVNGRTRAEAITRLERALSELYIQGVTTNTNQLLKIVRHEDFINGDYTNRLLLDHKELESGEPGEEAARLAAVFGAIAENAKHIQEAASTAFLSRDLENTVQLLRIKKLPIAYNVTVYSRSFEIELIQTDLDIFFVFVDGTFIGEVELLPRLENNFDYLMRFGVKYYPIRVDHKPTFTLLRMPEAEGKTHYYKLNIVAQGAGEKADPVGMVRSPFQSTFVAFAKDEIQKRDRIGEGSMVKKGDPVMIISAMKMETTLLAPIDGKVSYLIEDGDLGRLEIGRTPDGLVIGKPIAEGEVLFIIEDVSGAKDEKSEKVERKKKDVKHNHILDLLYDDKIIKLIEENPCEHVTLMLRLVKSHFLGFLPDDKIIIRVSEIFSALSPEIYKRCKVERVQSEITNIITFYTAIKKLNSAVLDTSLSYFGELNQYVRLWHDDTYRPSYNFKMTLAQLFKAYDVSEWMPKTGADNSRITLAFFNILRAHGACTGHTSVIQQLVEITSNFEKPIKKAIIALKGLILQEQAERDDSLAVNTGKLLKQLDIPQVNRDVIPIISRKYIPEYRNHVNDIFSSFQGIGSEELIANIKNSLKKPEKEITDPRVPGWFSSELKTRFDQLEVNYKISRLYSPFPLVSIYCLEAKKSDEHRYLVCAAVEKVDLERNDQGHIISSVGTERACIEATQLVRAYQKIETLKDNWVEIFACESPVDMDLSSSDPKVLSYEVFTRTGITVLRFFSDVAIAQTLIHIDAKSIRAPHEVTRRSLLLSRQGGALNLDLLIDEDARNPYFTGEPNPQNQRLFDRDKWPIDIWVKETFDSGSVKEITVPSVDEFEWENPKTGKKEFKPVGGRIYFGTIDEKPALYYMKDSRISGGASGNLEGLKYAAATYIAYRNNVPLYVWNDGAGANIKEGMISLNRAAQGFMMNALLGGRVDEETFNRYTRQCPDPVLRDLFAEIDELEANKNLLSKEMRKLSYGYFMVGVGIGSSTGLDVYGSSQMAIQVMVDSEHSYRVLTGSNVIKSVTGEDLTNYEIGGARVMGKWTGTVDLIATNKLHLMTFIRTIQHVFITQRSLDKIQRVDLKEIPQKQLSSASVIDVLNYDIIRENIDHGIFLPMKEEFYGSWSAVGGFGRLGGRSVLIMGPKTDFGIRTFAAITKAKELMMIARKTGSNQILIFGENWYHETIMEDELALRARADFLKILMQKSGVRIHIITHQDGLHRITMNSSADATIFVQPENISESESEVARKTATFVVENMQEAFDTAHKIIELLDPIETKSAKAPASKPQLPDDPAQPFDMVTHIIEPVLDKESFLEFFAQMNDKTMGPSLITGFGRLNGQSVGIIADQPAIMGGAPDAPGTEKFRVFTEMVVNNNLPLVMLSNAPGFVPGTKQERLRIQQIGGESLDVNVLGKIPVVSVVLNQNYGGRQIHAFSKFLRPGIVYLALKRSVMAVMGATASFDLFQGPAFNQLLKDGKKAEANKMKKEYIENYNQKASAGNDAMNTGVLDWLIDHVEQLRENLIKGLDEAKKRVQEIFY